MQKTKLPSLVTILILTLITVIMWVGFSIYRAFTAAPTSTVPQEILSTFSPTLDSDSINKIESSIFFNESEIPALSTGTPVATPTPIPSVLPTLSPISSPTATSSALPSETPSPTP